MAEQENPSVEQDAVKAKRKKIFIVCLVFAAIIFAAHYALKGTCAPGDEAFTAHDYFIKMFLPQLGNSTLVFSLLWFFGWPMLEGMVKDRKTKIERDIDESGRLKEAAEATMNEVSAKLENLEAEKNRMVEKYAESTKQESARIREDAARAAERLASDAQVSFELQANQARHAFELEVINEAVNRARNEIVTRLSQDSSLRDKLIDDSIASLEL